MPDPTLRRVGMGSVAQDQCQTKSGHCASMVWAILDIHTLYGVYTGHTYVVWAILDIHTLYGLY